MQTKKNKEFVINFTNSCSGVNKTVELLDLFIADEELKKTFIVLESAFPKFSMFLDEVIAESNRVVVRAMFIGTHMGDFMGISPTYKTVEVPYVVRYEIENNRIVSHWVMVDQMSLIEQIGLILNFSTDISQAKTNGN